MDVDAEREKISKEIKELERILDPGSSGINDDVSESSLDSDSEAGQRPPSLVRAALLPFLPWTVCFHPSFVRGDLPGAGPLPRAVLRAGLPGLGHQPSPCSSSHRAQTQGPLPGPRLPRLSFSPPHTLPQAPSAPPRSSDWRPACGGAIRSPPACSPPSGTASHRPQPHWGLFHLLLEPVLSELCLWRAPAPRTELSPAKPPLVAPVVPVPCIPGALCVRLASPLSG